MTTIIINGNEINFASNWSEVSYYNYLDIVQAQGLPLIERLSAYSNVDIALLNKIPIDGISRLIDLCRYMEALEVVPALVKPYSNAEFNIGLETYGKFETAKNHIKKEDGNILRAAPKVWKVYFNEDLEELPITESLSKLNFIVAAFLGFMDKYKRLNDYQMSDDEIEAGFEVFESFGSFPVIKSMAEKLHKTYDEIYNLTANEVYLTLLYDFEQAEKQKNLRDIVERNARIGKSE